MANFNTASLRQPAKTIFQAVHDTVVIAGNGPSLKDVPKTLFEKYPVLGCNSVYRVPYFWDNPVDYYSIEGMGHLGTEAEREDRKPYVRRVGDNGGWTFINRRAIHHFDGFPNIWGIDYMNPDGRGKRTAFSFDPLVQHGTGFSVMYWMQQLAHYLLTDGGTALIVGMDHRFDEGSWHAWEDEGPFDAMTPQRLPRWAYMAEPYYRMSTEAFQATGKTILNLTPNTGLGENYIPHGDLEDWA